MSGQTRPGHLHTKFFLQCAKMCTRYACVCVGIPTTRIYYIVDWSSVLPTTCGNADEEDWSYFMDLDRNLDRKYIQ